MKRVIVGTLVALVCVSVGHAQDAEEMARKLQDPLANIKALMTDNSIDFKTGDDDTSYMFQIQPVYAIPYEDKGFNMILRGVFPIVGLAPEAQKPVVGEPLPEGDDDTWGLADSQLQMFFAPRSEAAWKWGLGPLFSFPTHTDDALEGAGWGAGAAGVLVGGFSENVSFSMVGGHTEGENDFSTSFVQPMLYYNVPRMEGVALSYNNTIAYNWNADSDNAWTVPLGATVSKTLALSGGHGLDLGLGYYYNVEKPDGAADWAIKWAVTWLLP